MKRRYVGELKNNNILYENEDYEPFVSVILPQSPT
jgi:hypothetical protein